MTPTKLLVFNFFLFNFLISTFEVDNIDNVSQKLIDCPQDCTKMQNNRMYSINKVTECKLSPAN